MVWFFGVFGFLDFDKSLMDFGDKLKLKFGLFLV
jgi:hypothetical protein